jgi:hypothetical protein
MLAPGGPDGRALRLTLPDGQLLVVLDETGRIGRVETEEPGGLDASAAMHDDPADDDAQPLDPSELPTEAIELPVQEPPLAPDQDPEPPQPPTGNRQEDRGGYGPEGGDVSDGDAAPEEEPDEGPMRRLFGFLRGPKP